MLLSSTNYLNKKIKNAQVHKILAPSQGKNLSKSWEEKPLELFLIESLLMNSKTQTLTQDRLQHQNDNTSKMYPNKLFPYAILDNIVDLQH